MSDSLNNKELVAVGHQFAKAMSADTPIIDMAKIVSRLAERLDCTTAALRATQAQRDQLAAENAALKSATEFATAPDMWEDLGSNVMRYQYQEWYADKLKSAMQTPVTDASLAEVRAQGVALFAAEMGAIHAKCQAGGYFDRQVQVYGKAQELAELFINQLRQRGAA